MTSNLRVFIGSSSESVVDVVRVLRSKLKGALGHDREHVDLPAWYEIMEAGTPLDSVRDQLDLSDAGIFIFAKDDETKSRGEVRKVPRDNVVLEAGMWIARFGRERTFILLENGAARPSNFGDLELEPYNGGTLNDINVSLEDVCHKWALKLKKMEPMQRETRLRMVGEGAWLAETVRVARANIEKIEADIVRSECSQSDSVALRRPVTIGTEICLGGYLEALGKVERRFLTTTFVTSGFWRAVRGAVLHANETMLNNVGRGGDVRRLFLLPAPWPEFQRQQQEEFNQARRAGDSQALASLEDNLHGLRDVVATLGELGCKFKFACDPEGKSFRLLTQEVRDGGHHLVSEIAIYDDQRIDMYRAGDAPHISKLTIFPRRFNNFRKHLERAEQYFDSLWSDKASLDAPEKIHEWCESLQRWRARVDYNAHWLAFYELDLHPHDRAIKRSELDCALDFLRGEKTWGNHSRYLDIGACTARYPIALQDAGAFGAGAKVFALDEDKDCIDFMHQKLEMMGLRAQIKPVGGDFIRDEIPEVTNGGFDLVTCMLGTVSHFGGGDGVHAAVANMRKAMAPGGRLLIGSWSDHAVRSRSLLSIYSDRDKQHLSGQTPSQAELRALLEGAGFSVDIREPHLEMNLFCCAAAS